MLMNGNPVIHADNNEMNDGCVKRPNAYRTIAVLSLLLFLFSLMPCFTGDLSAADNKTKPDLSKDKTLYAVGYAHLDSQWRWDYTVTIEEYILNTMQENFRLFEKYPGYVFNFTGAVRYAMMKEYYPALYEKLKGYIRDGRWRVSGSSVDEGEVNVPSPESVIRQILYGNQYFRTEFGKESRDYILPDCFGFTACMPSVWAHCGLLGFSTQKLTWGSAVGIPFPLGVWEGPDGRSVIAALNPGSYGSAIPGRVDKNAEWLARIDENGKKYGVFADYNYYGVGDVGGAPREDDVVRYTRAQDAKDGDYRVLLASSDQLYKDITEKQKEHLPRYKGDLLLTEHSTGSLSSEAYMKRWNRKNELLADAAERAAATAHWLGCAPYPREKLNRAWVRVLASQMHDILPGTCLPKAYEFSWNDEVLALNQFAAVLRDSAGAVAEGLDTRVQGKAVVVYNPLSQEREDPVEARIDFSGHVPSFVRVFGPDGEETPSQILSRDDEGVDLLFMAKMPAVGFAVFDVRPANESGPTDTGLNVKDLCLENDFYKVILTKDGDVQSITDKKAGGRELLAKATSLEFQYEKPRAWPAWNMDWEDRKKPPIDYVKGPARIRIIEKGPVRVAIEVEREARDSIIRQEIRLAAGDAGKRVEFETAIDWQSTECCLKAAFPLTVENPVATYNMGLGAIERGNNNPKKYEVPSREWFDLTDRKGDYGVSVLEDCKFGSDKPDDATLRLTLLYTPGVRRAYMEQSSQDWGRHEMLYALYGHEGDWRKGCSEWQARRLNLPLRAFVAPSHAGELGARFSLLSMDTPQVDARALKVAEAGDRMIVRLQELFGQETGEVKVTFPAPIVEACEMDGQERPLGKAMVQGNSLLLNLSPFSLHTYGVKLAPPSTTLLAPTCEPVALDFDTDVISSDADRDDGNFHDGRSLPAEMFASRIVSEGIPFQMGSGEHGRMNALACRGQTVNLPEGDFDRIYLLAAADEDTAGEFDTGGAKTRLVVQAWTGFIGQWDRRVFDREFERVDYRGKGNVIALLPGFIKRDDVAWFCTHRHSPEGNEAYRFSYLFKYALPLPGGARTLRLPDRPAIKILAVTAAGRVHDTIEAAAPLYDDFTNRPAIDLRAQPPGKVQLPPPTGRVIMDRKERFEDLAMGAPANDDYADRNAGHGVEVYFVKNKRLAVPHPSAGAEGPLLPRLNDGDRAQNNDDVNRTVWFDNGEPRFIMDLMEPLPVDRINTYSWHWSNRAPQCFTLWGATGETAPDPLFDIERPEGWTFLAKVDTEPLGQGGIHGSTVEGENGSLGTYRYLLWIGEDAWQGTFFTEIDVYPASH